MYHVHCPLINSHLQGPSISVKYVIPNQSYYSWADSDKVYKKRRKQKKNKDETSRPKAAAHSEVTNFQISYVILGNPYDDHVNRLEEAITIYND